MKTHLSDHLKTEEVLVVTRAKKQNPDAVPGVGRMGVRPLLCWFQGPSRPQDSEICLLNVIRIC